MTIQEWGAVGELLGGVAVVVTLVYLALQVRQNTRAIRLSTSHTVAEEVRGIFALMAEHNDLAVLVAKAAQSSDALDGVEKIRYYGLNGNFMRAMENAYIQRVQGELDSRHWAGMQRMMTDYAQLPGFREFWPNRKHWFSEDFQEFVDAEIMPKEGRPDVPLPGSY